MTTRTVPWPSGGWVTVNVVLGSSLVSLARTSTRTGSLPAGTVSSSSTVIGRIEPSCSMPEFLMFTQPAAPVVQGSSTNGSGLTTRFSGAVTCAMVTLVAVGGAL